LSSRDMNEYEGATRTATDTDEESYTDKKGHGSIGKLFDAEDDGDFDDGYSPPKRSASRGANVSPVGDTDYYAALNDNRMARGDRSRPATAPTGTTRKIERPVTRANPEPKPAMKARVPVVREPIPRRVATEEPENFTPIEDDVENFKARYSDRDALATARDPGAPAKPDADDRVLHPVVSKNRPRAAAAPPPGLGYSFAGVNPIRYVAMAGALVVLVVMIVLVVQNSRMGRELDDLRTAGGTTAPPATTTNGADPADPVNGANITELEVSIAALEDQLTQAQANMLTLENWVRAQGYNPDHAFNPPAPEHTPPPTVPDPTPTPPPPPYIIHTVASGESLSAIARIHFGSAGEVYWRRIAAENDITHPYNLSIGQQLRIPMAPTS